MTPLRERWVQASSAVASWWRRMPQDRAKSRVGVERDGVVSELFLTTRPQGAFTAAEVGALASRLAALLKRHSPMKIASKNPTVGAAMPPGVRRAGRSWPKGSG